MTANKIRELDRLGESSQVEFKSSMRYDFKTQQVNKDLTKVISKSVCGFLNCDGGHLLIGVSDDGTIVGIENDIQTLSRQDRDYYELTLRNSLGNFLGAEISPTIGISFGLINEKLVALVLNQACVD